MAAVHPLAWAHEHDSGRGAFLVFGHAAAFADPLIGTVIRQAVAWTAG